MGRETEGCERLGRVRVSFEDFHSEDAVLQIFSGEARKHAHLRL